MRTARSPREYGSHTDALRHAEQILLTCNDAAIDILRGLLRGHAQAYALADPEGYAIVMRELAAATQPPRGVKPRLVFYNAERARLDDRGAA